MVWCSHGQIICLLEEMNLRYYESTGYEENGMMVWFDLSRCCLPAVSYYKTKSWISGVLQEDLSSSKLMLFCPVVPFGIQSPFHRSRPLKVEGKKKNWNDGWKRAPLHPSSAPLPPSPKKNFLPIRAIVYIKFAVVQLHLPSNLWRKEGI